MKERLRRARDWYEINEKPISTGSLVFGFVFDSLTLQRIDSLLDNLWFLANLIAAAVCIIFLSRLKHGVGEGEWKHFWLINLLQFCFGALLGGFFIFYFRSAALETAWPFLLILLLAIAINELFQKRYARLAYQLSFLYLTVFSFVIFLLPLIFHRIGRLMFISSGIVSIGAFYLFVRIIGRFAKEKFLEEKTHIWRLVAIIFVTVNVLYFSNLIPPIPLALKDAGIYHSIARDSRGAYLVSEEKGSILERYLRFHQRVHWLPGESLYAYTAIFAPSSLNTSIVHEWQYRDTNGDWRTAAWIPLHLSGGRTEGFRTFSVKTNLTPGRWRVNVETPRGELLGRINFEVIVSNTAPPLTSINKR